MLTHIGPSQVLPAVMIPSFHHLGHTIHYYCPCVTGWVLREDSKMEFRVQGVYNGGPWDQHLWEEGREAGVGREKDIELWCRSNPMGALEHMCPLGVS